MILADYRWIGPHGIGRFAREVLSRVPQAQPLSVSWPPLHPWDAPGLAWVLWRLRPRVYYSPGFNPPLYSRVPYVFTIHDLIHLHFPAESGLAKQAYYRLVVKPAAERAERVLTVSRYTQQEILSWSTLPEERVVVVGNGVSPAFCPEGDRHTPGYPYVLYVGNHKPHKNLSRLFQSLARSGHARDVRLLLTGAADPALQHEITTLGLQRQVVYTGYLTDTQLAAYYRGALALLCPSLYEGFGLPALEAMACATPVLSANVSALPEVVGDAALLVDPYDVEAMSWGVQRILEDSCLRQALRRKGPERARQFTWEHTARRVQRVLQDVPATL